MTLKSVLPLLLVSGFSLQAEVDFGKEVWPIFKESCLKCHGPDYIDSKGKERTAKAGLRLDSVEAIMKGSKDEIVVVPGKPEESSLYKLTLLPDGHDDLMPAKGDRLTQAQTDILKAWITEGAKFGTWEKGEK
jgi:mono/diheme cytochrome c family protein